MAGIGFQLRDLIKEKSFFGGIKAFAFTAIIFAGPLILCIFLISLSQYYLDRINAPYFEKELFLAGSLYSFIFSQLITGGFIMMVTRYLADQLYSGKKEYILSSLYGLVTIVLAVSGVIGMIFYAWAALDFMYKLTAYLFFMELVVLWLLSMYVTALKHYKQLVSGFLIGILLSALAIWFCYAVLQLITATQLFICLDFGFFITILLLFRSIKRHFPVNNNRYFDWLIYLEKYPSLFLIGLLYTIGLYGHIFIVWGSTLQTIVSHSFIIAPLYDLPIFYAYLTILPAMIMFVVSVETSFYEKYKTFYTKLLGSSTFQEIKDAGASMFTVLTQQLVFLMEFQLFFTVCAIALGTRLLPLTTEQVDIFNIVVIGNYFFIIMFILLQILLYFDDRRGVLLIMFSYVLTSLFVTPITVSVESYGLSCFIAGPVGLGLALLRLGHFSKNFGYYTYCSQPLISKEKQWFMQGMAKKLHSLNGSNGGKYEVN